MTRGGLIAVTLGLATIFTGFYNYGTSDTVKITVKDKERITESSTDSDGNSTTSSKYLIFAAGETFENTDTFLRLKFNSSDVQGSLDRGKTYNCKVYGWRLPFFSKYRNIVSCTPIPQ